MDLILYLYNVDLLICNVSSFWISGSAVRVNKVSWYLNLSPTESRDVKKVTPVT